MKFKLKHNYLLQRRFLSSPKISVASTTNATQEEEIGPTTTKKPPASELRSHRSKLNYFFRSNPNLKGLKQHIPAKYCNLKQSDPDNLYLINPDIAKNVVSHVLPTLQANKNQLVCETNAGLGLITAELLLNKDINLVRLYESCSEFRSTLKEFDNIYPGRVELFTKDIFQLHRYDYMDKTDKGNRVLQLLKGVPQKSWVDDPAMTIIGTLSKKQFIKYLIISLILQKTLATYGRIQLFALMKPKDFIVLSASPQNNLHTYQSWSVLFQLFCDYELLEKYPRNMFLPWEKNVTITCKTRYAVKTDPNFMYLVKINLKKDLPVYTEQLVALFYFVRQFFGQGRMKIVPTIEKWVPNCGQYILIPKLEHGSDYFTEMSIFTEFGELTPQQILYVFREMINFDAYHGSPFMAMVESQLVKFETIETAVDNAASIKLEKTIVDDIEYKLNSNK